MLASLATDLSGPSTSALQSGRPGAHASSLIHESNESQSINWLNYCCICQEALTSFRARAASCGLWFRPRIFGADAPAAADDNAQAAEAAASDSSCSPGQDYHNFETLYLSCHKAVKGILQLHKARDEGELVLVSRQ